MRQRSVPVPAATLILLVGLGRSSAAQVTVIDFEPLACSTGFSVSHPAIALSGFEFTTNLGSEFRVLCADYPGGYVASASVYNATAGATTTLRKTSGDAFALKSIDLAPYYFYLQPLTLGFTGVTSAGGQVFESFAIPGGNGQQVFTTFTFGSGFADVLSVTWTMDYPFHQWDNVAVGPASTVPEPATIVLLATGLLSFSVFRVMGSRRPPNLRLPRRA